MGSGREISTHLRTCAICLSLMGRFSQAVRNLVTLHERYVDAIIRDDPEAARLESMIEAANEERNNTKDLCVLHMQQPHRDAYPVLAGEPARVLPGALPLLPQTIEEMV